MESFNIYKVTNLKSEVVPGDTVIDFAIVLAEDETQAYEVSGIPNDVEVEFIGTKLVCAKPYVVCVAYRCAYC